MYIYIYRYMCIPQWLTVSRFRCAYTSLLILHTHTHMHTHARIYIQRVTVYLPLDSPLLSTLCT